MGRSPCCDGVGLKKGPWTAEEDRKLVRYVAAHGHGSWRALPKLAELNRCGKSCRLRWTNYLRPDIKRGKFTEEEEHRIVELHSTLGNKWSAIAKHLPGRTDNEIKNYWNTHIRKKLIKMGIDPITHRQRADLSLLANLPSLLALSAANSTGFPLDGAFGLQSNAEQLARIHLAQTLVQILAGGGSSCAIPAMDDPSGQVGPGFLPNQMSNNIINPNSHGFPQLHNRISPPSLYTSQQQVSTIPTDIGNTFFAATTDSTPSLVSASPEDVAVNHMSEFKIPNNTNMSNVKLPTNEPWEGLDLGDISDGSYWMDILDQVSSPAWNILQS